MRLLWWMAAITATACAQSIATFEVASIKPSNDPPGSASFVNTETGRVHAQNVTLKRCIRSAYGVPESQIAGGPKWADEDRYVIDAKAPIAAGDSELSVMMQSLLADRFKLTIHRETRMLPGYALVVSKTGVTAKRSASDGPSIGNSSRTMIDAQSCTMNQLAMKLSEVLHLPVADATAVAGKFDFHLEWTPEDTQAKAAGSIAAEPGISIFAALQEKLGLKLEAHKVPTEVVVIDRAEKPSEN